ncbi:hypothetical protein BH10CHL1_BH10CHL1_11450 [soil metagenome]
MYLDRTYRPRRRRQGAGRFWPVYLLIALGIILYKQQPAWLSSRQLQPTPTPTRSAIAYLSDAESALKAGKYDEAQVAYAEANRLEPNNADGWAAQSEIQMIFRDATKAYEFSQRAVNAGPKNPRALTAQARALNWLGKNEQALDAALNALDADPQYATALAVLGEIYTDEGNVAKAEDYLKQAQALEPNNVTMLRNWAYLYQRRQQYPEAISAYDAALAVAPVRFDLFLEKGLLYRVSLADYKNANAAYDRAVRLYKSPVTLDYYGEGLYNSDDPLQAVRVLREAVEIDPTYGPAQAHLGMALFIRHNYEDAVAPLEKGIQLLGDKARTEQFYTLGLAYIYKEPSDCDKAAFWLNKALTMDPGNSIALSGMNNLKSCETSTDTLTSTLTSTPTSP